MENGPPTAPRELHALAVPFTAHVVLELHGAIEDHVADVAHDRGVAQGRVFLVSGWVVQRGRARVAEGRPEEGSAWGDVSKEPRLALLLSGPEEDNVVQAEGDRRGRDRVGGLARAELRADQRAEPVSTDDPASWCAGSAWLASALSASRRPPDF